MELETVGTHAIVEEVTKITKTNRIAGQRGRDLNSGPPENEAELLTNRIRLFVLFNCQNMTVLNQNHNLLIFTLFNDIYILPLKSYVTGNEMGSSS